MYVLPRRRDALIRIAYAASAERAITADCDYGNTAITLAFHWK
jgi:hypothetical protein